jgi:hypothetical protein
MSPDDHDRQHNDGHANSDDEYAARPGHVERLDSPEPELRARGERAIARI